MNKFKYRLYKHVEIIDPAEDMKKRYPPYKKKLFRFLVI